MPANARTPAPTRKKEKLLTARSLTASLGTLYGVGVGPGDPELLTLKAARVLGQVDVVFASTQQRSGKSLALEIARPHLPAGCEIVPLLFSHTFEAVAGGQAHRENAAIALDVLRRPASAAFLTLGDPMTYSTFTYLLAALQEQEPRIPVEVIPGITSFAAAAAAAHEPLAEGDESLAVVSAARGATGLKQALSVAENVVVMKAYRHAPEVCDVLDDLGLGESTTFVERCSRPDAVTLQGTDAVRERPPSYLSLFLVRRPGGARGDQT